MPERAERQGPGNAIAAALASRLGRSGSRESGNRGFVRVDSAQPGGKNRTAVVRVGPVKAYETPTLVTSATDTEPTKVQVGITQDSLAWKLYGERTASIDTIIQALTEREIPHVDEEMLTSLSDIAEKRRQTHAEHTTIAAFAAQVDTDQLQAAEAKVLEHLPADDANGAVYRDSVARVRAAVEEATKEPEEATGPDVYEEAFARRQAVPTEDGEADQAVATLQGITELLADPDLEAIAHYKPPAEMTAVAQDASAQARDQAAEYRAERVEALRQSPGLKAKTLRQAIEVVRPHASEENPGAQRALKYLEDQLDLRIEALENPELMRAGREAFAAPRRDGPLRHLLRIPREVRREINQDGTVSSKITYNTSIGTEVNVVVKHASNQKMKDVVKLRQTRDLQSIVVIPNGKVDDIQISYRGNMHIIFEPGEFGKVSINREESAWGVYIQDTHINQLVTDADVDVIQGYIGEATVLEGGQLTMQQGNIGNLSVIHGGAKVVDGEVAQGNIDGGELTVADGDVLALTLKTGSEASVNGRVATPQLDQTSSLTQEELRAA